MKTIKIILSWMFLYPFSLLVIAVGNSYLWIKEDMKFFKEMVIDNIK